MDQDGENHRFLTNGEHLVLTPRFSATAQEITYLSYFHNQPRVYILHIDTGQQEVVGNFPNMTFAPRFSPDGNKIIMSLSSEGNSDVYTMDLRTRLVKRLTDHLAIDTSPSFAPDERYIAFNSDRGGSQQIYVMDSDGRNVKRISFGTKFNTPNCGGSSTNFLLMSWSSGVTEGGSSGAGIWRNSDQLLFGTLTCGVSSCVNPNGNDSYGRFDRAYNAGGFSVPLAAGSDDAFENNDSCATAAALPSGTFGGQVVKSIDEDWYVVTLATLGNITVDLTFTHSFGDIDMELFDACGGAVVASAVSNTNDETLSYTNSGPTAVTLFLRIFLADDTRNDYTMTVSIVLPCPEDTNGDGNINVIDLINVLLCFGLPDDPPCHTGQDVNADGTVNVLDLIDVLLLFGTSCP